jgi:calmodulin
MSEPLFTVEECENFRNAFDAFDDNRDELVSVEVLGKLLRAVGFNPRPTEIEDMVADIGSRSFDFNAFLYLIARHGREADPEAELVDAFRTFDKKGTGCLKTDVIRKILQNLNEPYQPEQIAELLGQAAIDPKTDTIRYDDFVKLLLDF